MTTERSQSLTELAAQEMAILKRVCELNGLMEDKFKACEENGYFTEYRDIHKRYVALIADDEIGTESLKRAMFIQWYSMTEPGCFTGICELDPFSSRAVPVALEQRIKSSRLDQEFNWMLSWYWAIADFVFGEPESFPVINDYLRKIDGKLHPNPWPTEERFNGRGQMAKYWLSINRRPVDSI